MRPILFASAALFALAAPSSHALTVLDTTQQLGAQANAPGVSLIDSDVEGLGIGGAFSRPLSVSVADTNISTQGDMDVDGVYSVAGAATTPVILSNFGITGRRVINDDPFAVDLFVQP